MSKTVKILLLLAVTAIAVTVAFPIVNLVNKFIGLRQFRHETILLRKMIDLRPHDVTVDEWEHMIGWTFNLHAYCDPSEIGFERTSYKHYLRELETRLNTGSFGKADIAWIWQSYNQFAPKSRPFVEEKLPTTAESRQNTQPGQFGLKIK